MFSRGHWLSTRFGFVTSAPLSFGVPCGGRRASKLRIRGGVHVPCRRLVSSLSRNVSTLSLPNMRDVASAIPEGMRPAVLYRGAAPLCATDCADATNFLCSVERFIDLRSRDEQRKDSQERLLQLCGEDYLRRSMSIPLLNRRRVLYGLARVTPLQEFGSLTTRAILAPSKIRSVIVDAINAGGLVLLNRILLESASSGIVRTLRRISCEAMAERCWRRDLGQRGNPIYLFCSAGKDRTGLVTALVLSQMGASKDQIVSDYALSANTWESGPVDVRAEYTQMLVENGLDPDVWLGAPAEVMDDTLEYVATTYGSVSQYLEAAGFSLEEQNILRKSLSV